MRSHMLEAQGSVRSSLSGQAFMRHRGVRVSVCNVNVNVSNLLAIPESDFDNSGEPGPQAVCECIYV